MNDVCKYCWHWNGYPIGLGSCVISFIETVLDYKVMQIESCWWCVLLRFTFGWLIQPSPWFIIQFVTSLTGVLDADNVCESDIWFGMISLQGLSCQCRCWCGKRTGDAILFLTTCVVLSKLAWIEVLQHWRLGFKSGSILLPGLKSHCHSRVHQRSLI
jgi:hypothetical protein